MSDKNPIKVAVVGCGAVADLHLKALAAVANTQCTALFDIDRKRSEAARIQHRLKAEIVDELEAIADKADAALLAVPNAYHADYSIRLLRAGVHVLCEKPLTTSLADARRVSAAATAADRVLMCALVRRFFGSTQLAAEALQRELVGQPLYCEIRESSWGWPFSRAFFDPRTSGGGVLMDTGPHVLDVLAYLLGPMQLLDYQDDNQGGVEANAFLKVRCAAPSGLVKADIHLSRSVPLKSRWRIVCTKGSLEISPHQQDRIKLSFKGEPNVEMVMLSSLLRDPFVAQWKNFLAAIKGDELAQTPGEQSAPVIELIEQCYRVRGHQADPSLSSVARPAVAVKPSALRKILVTGAAGLIGSRLVELWAEQHQLPRLRCMVRSFHTAGRIMRFPVEVVEADLLNPESLGKALAGCDAVIHLGAGEKAGRETQTIAAAALAAGVKRFVHLSSACVYGLGLPSRLEALQEDTKVIKTGELYADGKAQAEWAVLRAVKSGLPAVMLRPQVVYGPGMRWSVELMQLLAQGEICVLEDGGWANLIYIDDLVSAISLALDSNISGGSAFFITDGEPVRWSEYILRHAQLIGAHPTHLPRRDVLPHNQGLVSLVKESFLPLLPVLRTPEFRAFVLKSPLMQATVFRGYLALRERPAVRGKLHLLRNGSPGSQTESPGTWNEHWIQLQLSAARLSAARAEQELGFKAKIQFAAGLRRSLDWFQLYGLAASEVGRNPFVTTQSDRAAVSR